MIFHIIATVFQFHEENEMEFRQYFYPFLNQVNFTLRSYYKASLKQAEDAIYCFEDWTLMQFILN